ncbi:MAG: hypothetical protein WC533_03375 [Candidatus Pacearchaeota archaeon]
MKKILILSVAFMFLLIPFVSAALRTEVTVTAEEEQNLIIRVLKANTNETIERLERSTGSDGEAKFAFSTEELQNVWFKVMVTENQEVVDTKYFTDNYVTGSTIDLNMFEEKIEEITSEQEQNESVNTSTESATLIPENSQENTENKNVSVESGITGFSISKYTDAISKAKYYLLGFMLVVILVFVVTFIVKKKVSRKDRPIKVIKMRSAKDEMEDAQKKIEDAQKDLESLKKRQRVFDVEEQIQKDREELERLKKEQQGGFY